MTALAAGYRIFAVTRTEAPQFIRLSRLAEGGERIQGEVRLAEFGRLPDSVLNRDAALAYRLCFYRDEAGARVDVEIDARLIMDCQRCLQPVAVAIHKRTLLAITKITEKIQSLDARYEPFALAGDELSIMQLLEDELLLAAPFSPLHPEAECAGKQALDKINAEARPGPFAALAGLKGRGKA